METVTSSTNVSLPREPASYDEVLMQLSLLFSDSLKDLKNLRKQLYSAAEYFELSYTNDDRKQIVVDTLKDYAIKAFVNTADHLGTATCKVEDLLDAKVDEVSRTDIRVSCVEERIQTCQEYVDKEGLSQQSLVINIPKYHKIYILPERMFSTPIQTLCSVGEAINGGTHIKSEHHGSNLDDANNRHEIKNVRASFRVTSSSSDRKERSASPCPQPSQKPVSFYFKAKAPRKDLVKSDKREASPHRFSLLRSGSLSIRPTTITPRPNSRPTTPNPSRPMTPSLVGIQRYPLEIRKSASTRLHADREMHKEAEQVVSKSKRLFKVLLGRRKTKKDEMLYAYLDEY